MRNVLRHKVRSSLTGLGVAVAIMAVFALGVLTYSLRETAISILRTGSADFSVGQKGVSDILYSSIDEAEVARLASYPEVQEEVGDTLYGEDQEQEFRVVGIFSTGQVFGDSASMLPLVALQGLERKPGNVTLAFVNGKA